MNAAANIVTLYSTREGQGRVDADPFWTPEHKRNHLHLTYASQVSLHIIVNGQPLLVEALECRIPASSNLQAISVENTDMAMNRS